MRKWLKRLLFLVNQNIGFEPVDKRYLRHDKKFIRRTQNLQLIPTFMDRRGGKKSYGEWCHVVGIFQTIILEHLTQPTGTRILDVGCGTGLLGIASAPFLEEGGKYLGIDVQEDDIRFCKQHYPSDQYAFQHLDIANASYAPDQSVNKLTWDVADGSMDLVTALSVWTHLNEEDAVFYFREIDRVLKNGSRAIITFFFLDDDYYAHANDKPDSISRYHNTLQNKWIFDQISSQSQNWFHPEWAKHPENAIGVTPTGLDMMLQGTSLSLLKRYSGNWREKPGVFFQDILVFEKQ